MSIKQEVVSRLSLRPETDEDTEFLYTAYASTRADEMQFAKSNGWTDEQVEDFLRTQFKYQLTDYRRTYDTSRFFIIMLDDTPIGRFYVVERPDKLNFADIIVLPEYQKQGIGRYYMDGLLEEGRQKNKLVSLHVYSDSWVRQLYERLGFIELDDNQVHTYMEWYPDGRPSDEWIEERKKIVNPPESQQ